MGKVINWSNLPKQQEPDLSGGGGGTTFDPMEARVTALEKDMVELKSDVKAVRTDLSYIRGKFDGMPSAAAFGELKGRVDSLPTTAKLATLLGIAVAAITILNNWESIKALIGQ